MKVALYLRVSKDDGRQDVANQRLQLEDFCKRQGWPIVAEFADRASGKSGDRPQFRKMLDAASRKEFDLLLFWSVDRLSREGTLAVLQYLRQLDSWGVQWRSFTEPYFDAAGPFKDVVLSVAATLARQERLKIVERTKAGLERARKAGKAIGRPALDIDIEKLRQLQAEGMSIRQLAKKFKISPNSVLKYLKSEAA
jgi:DNA invertase Pin-like site-specific DNA recombinase